MRGNVLSISQGSIKTHVKSSIFLRIAAAVGVAASLLAEIACGVVGNGALHEMITESIDGKRHGSLPDSLATVGLSLG